LGAIVLLAAGCLLLGTLSRSRTSTASSQPSRSPLQNAILSSSPSTPLARPGNSEKPNSAQALSLLGQLPLLFEPNVGQVNLGQVNLGQVNQTQTNQTQIDETQINKAQINKTQGDSGVKFLARGRGYSLFLDSEGATLALRSQNPKGAQTESVRMKLAGASRSARIEGTDLLPGKTNYFLGNDPAKWRTGVPQFARVRYENVYPGINLVFYGNQGQLEYDFQIAPGADPAQAQLEFEGSQKLELSSGGLTLKGEGGNLLFAAPVVYQEIDGRRQPVEARFAMLASNRVGFAVGAYDHSRELIIDPVLSYATYFGGTGNDTSPSVAVDILGNIYLAGSTTSPDLPVTTTALYSTLNTPTAQNIFILKLNPQDGTGGIEYLTYLGGSGTDTNVGVGVDGGLNVYVAGYTTSPNFPTTITAYQTAPNSTSTPGNQHVFVSALAPNSAVPGSYTLSYSSYLSGSGVDLASGMAIDSGDNVYVTGTTTSTAISDEGSLINAFPASYNTQPFQAITRGAPIQFFVTKVATGASGVGSISYSTYFGGGTPSNPCPTGPVGCTTTVGGGIAVDTSGNIYFAGTTSFIYTGTSPTTDFPILNAYQPCLDQPPPNPNTNPQTCTNAAPATDTDAFVAKLTNPNLTSQGATLAWSTYFGGPDVETGTGVAVDAGALNVYITGATNSPLFVPSLTLATFSPFQLCLDQPPNPSNPTTCTPPANPLTNAYVARFNNPAVNSTTGSNIMGLTYFSYLGGSIAGTQPNATGDAGLAITVDPAGDALITGYTQTTDFPLYPPNTGSCAPPNRCVIQNQLAGPQNAFLGRINTAALSGQSAVGTFVTYYGGNDANATTAYPGDRGTSIAIDQNLNTYFAGDTTSTNLTPLGLTLNPLQAQNNGGVDTFVVEMGTAADLAITNAQLSNPNSSNQVPVGTQVSTVYTVTNEGPDLATNVVVLGTIPLGTTFNSASATSGSCASTVTTGGVACTIASMQAGATATVTIALTANSVGQYTGTATVSSPNNINLGTPNNVGSVTFKATDFFLSVTPPATQVAAAGDTAFYTVTVTPDPVYGANVSLSVSGIPGTGSKSSFTQQSLTLTGASPASATLAVSTTARPINVGSLRPGRGALYAVFLVFPAMAFLGLGTADKRRRLSIAGLLLICGLFGLLFLQPACSSATTPPNAGGTQPGTYHLVVTASGGTFSRNQTVQLVVP
jgi:uncharacterized repeat protein (TIGR01451 family)